MVQAYKEAGQTDRRAGMHAGGPALVALKSNIEDAVVVVVVKLSVLLQT